MSNAGQIAFVGFDIGGSKTDVVAEIPGLDGPLNLRASGENFQKAGAKRTASKIVSLVEQIRLRTGFEGPFRLCIGIAGAGRPEEKRELDGAICAALQDPEFRIVVLSDAEIALEGAFSGGSGMIVIAGTGSGVYATDNQGGFCRAGGWGPTIGDPGSGRQLGLKGLRAVARAMDGGQKTSLQIRISENLGVASRNDLIEAVYGRNLRYADLAPLVLAEASAGDDVATRIVFREVRALARDASVAASTHEPIEPRIVLIGGLFNDAYYREALGKALLDAIPEFHIVSPEATPSEGALRIARSITGPANAT